MQQTIQNILKLCLHEPTQLTILKQSSRPNYLAMHTLLIVDYKASL